MSLLAGWLRRNMVKRKLGCKAGCLLLVLPVDWLCRKGRERFTRTKKRRHGKSAGPAGCGAQFHRPPQPPPSSIEPPRLPSSGGRQHEGRGGSLLVFGLVNGFAVSCACPPFHALARGAAGNGKRGRSYLIWWRLWYSSSPLCSVTQTHQDSLM